MKRGHPAKLFGTFGVILVAVTVNTLLASQGGKAVLKTPLIHDERAAMCFFALMIGSVLLFLTGATGFLYAGRSSGPWHDRIPAIWLKGLDTGTIEGRIFQLAVLAILVVLPAVCFVHFLDVVWNSKLCVLDSTARPVMVSDNWFSGIAGANNQVRLVEDLLPNGTCGKGVQVFPGWEFSAVWIAVLASLLMACSLLLRIAWRKPSPGTTSGALTTTQ
jgi:hypothetical protein